MREQPIHINPLFTEMQNMHAFKEMWDISPIFILISTLAILSPGPDILYTVARGIIGGPKPAIAAAAGFTCGLSVHTSCAVLGISALLMASATAFLCVKIAGAAYLVYLGLRAWGSKGLMRLPEVAEHPPLKRIFGQAFLMNILNPKVAMFFLAFLPQFIHPGKESAASQSLVLGVCFAILTFILFSLAGVCGAFLAKHILTRPRQAIILDRVVGSLFIALAVRLALAGRH
jgi:threonine/homoserine/homoserine lactone efflux protein